MPKKTYKCLICRKPTVADNKLCKNPACLGQRLKERIHIMPAEERAPASGVFISLVRCTHGIMLDKPCGRCEREWAAAQKDTINEYIHEYKREKKRE